MKTAQHEPIFYAEVDVIMYQSLSLAYAFMAKIIIEGQN